MEKKIYAAYGSNMNIVQMAKRCPRARIRGIGTLEDYKLTFRGKSRGVANIEECENAQVPIVLWEITKICEAALDRYEGFPRLYVKKWITVVTEAGVIEAMAYVMAEPYASIYNYPPNDYVNTIRQGYIQNGICDSTLTEAVQKNLEILERMNVMESITWM